MTETFAIVPASSRGLWILVILVLLLFAGITAMLVKTARGSTQSRFEISVEGLRLRGDLYGRVIPRSSLRGAEARVVDLRAEEGLAPRRRTMGTSFPGYHAGWFRLRNDEKALLYLTDRSRAVYVPTTEGYSLLLSPREPDRFVDRLREIAPGT